MLIINFGIFNYSFKYTESDFITTLRSSLFFSFKQRIRREKKVPFLPLFLDLYFHFVDFKTIDAIDFKRDLGLMREVFVGK